MDEIKKTKELVKRYLKKTMKNYSDDKFSEKVLEFLARYSVKKEGCESEILKKLGHKGKVQDYYDGKEAVEQAKNCIQAIYERFNTKRNSQKEKEHPVDVFGDDFEAFFAWWCDKTPEDGIRRCYYCEIDEDTVRAAFDKNDKNDKNGGVISSKKRSFSGELQIERKNPNEDYSADNCEFACVICNNAKSDMISEGDFRDFFVPGIKEYWEHIKEKL